MVLREALIKHHLQRELEPTSYYPLKEESRKCLKNLAAFKPKEENPYQSHRYPRSRCAAVLVALFVGRQGDLYVLLSRRALTMRSFAGDTSLPGGKAERRDRCPEETARREAFEEIGLPPNKRRVPLLCVLEPFLSPNHLIVFPVVVLVTDPKIKPLLNEPEVAALFSHPLRSMLSVKHPFPLLSKSEQNKPHSEYHTFRDLAWGAPGSHVRIHYFLTGREGAGLKPIFGLTAAMLIRTAIIGYGHEFPLEFEFEAPTQLTMSERIQYAMMTVPILVEACKKEGVKVGRHGGCVGGEHGVTKTKL